MEHFLILLALGLGYRQWLRWRNPEPPSQNDPHTNFPRPKRMTCDDR